MRMNINVNFSGDFSKLVTPEVTNRLEAIHQGIHTKSAAGAEFLGWVDWPSNMSAEFLQDIQNSRTSSL